MCICGYLFIGGLRVCTDRDSTTPFYLTISGLLASGGTGTATTSIHVAIQALHASC